MASITSLRAACTRYDLQERHRTCWAGRDSVLEGTAAAVLTHDRAYIVVPAPYDRTRQVNANGINLQGEWRDGVMEGLGVRVFKSGRLTAGRWAGGGLAEELAPQACAAAVQAADRAAQAARQVKVKRRRLCQREHVLG